MPSYYTLSTDTEEVVQRGELQLKIYFDIAEKRLSTSEWWYGNEWSIFDTYLHWCYTRAKRGGYSLDPFPALIAHQSRVEARASFKRRVAIEQGG